MSTPEKNDLRNYRRREINWHTIFNMRLKVISLTRNDLHIFISGFVKRPKALVPRFFLSRELLAKHFSASFICERSVPCHFEVR